jgi:hypothetical protein
LDRFLYLNLVVSIESVYEGKRLKLKCKQSDTFIRVCQHTIPSLHKPNPYSFQSLPFSHDARGLP